MGRIRNIKIGRPERRVGAVIDIVAQHDQLVKTLLDINHNEGVLRHVPEPMRNGRPPIGGLPQQWRCCLVAELSFGELGVVLSGLHTSNREDEQTEQTLRQDVSDGVSSFA